MLHDLNYKLRFEQNYFDNICVNLVLPYIKNYRFALMNMYNCLKKNGTLIVTSLKPNYDLSIIYKKFVTSNPSKEDIEEARKLLGSAGQIKYKGKLGRYKFFDKNYFFNLLKELCIKSKDVRTMRSFNNQVNIFIIKK